MGDWTLAGLIKRLNDQRQLIEKIEIRLNDLGQHEEGMIVHGKAEQRIQQLERNLEFALLANKTIAHNLVKLREDLRQLHSENGELRARLDNMVKERTADTQNFTKSTCSETICSVLKLLTDNSDKSSREISHNIHRSREHTARLMKRLSQMGLVTKAGPNTPARFVLTASGKEAVQSLTQNVIPG